MNRPILLLLLTVATAPAFAAPLVAGLTVGPQHDTTQLYVAPDQMDRFVQSFVATSGGASTTQVVVTVTPTPSSTTSQL